MPTTSTSHAASDGDYDRQLRRLASELRIDAQLWRHRGLLGLADRLQEAADTAEGWIGGTWNDDE